MLTYHLPKHLKASLWGAFLLWGALALAPIPMPTLAAQDETVRVARVLDGDSLILADGRELRIIGLNTPEGAKGVSSTQPVADDARKTLKQLTAGKMLTLIHGREGRDRHGRILAHLRLPTGELVAAKMLEQGMGFHIAVGDNTRFIERLRAAEARARDAQRGVWHESYHAVHEAAAYPRSARGFVRLRGHIIKTGRAQAYVYLDLAPGLSVHIPHRYWPRFKLELSTLKGRRITVRGWLSKRGKRRRIQITHPAMIEQLH